MTMNDLSKPMRAVRLTLKLDADDMRELSYALRTLADHAERNELTTGVMGGAYSGYIYELLVDPTITHNSYHAALREYLDGLKAQQAEPVQPVAGVDERAISWLAGRRNKASAHVTTTLSAAKSLERPMALYTAPQPQQTEPSQDTPPQHEYEVTANDDGTFSVALPDGEELRIIPPQRKPLTEEEIINIGKEARAIEGPHFLPVTFARAIERAHGIKEKA